MYNDHTENGFSMFSTEQGAAPDLLTETDHAKPAETDGREPASPSRRFGPPLKTTNRKKTPSHVLRSRWRKAINSVIVKNRTARLALGFTKTRVQQSQSLMARVDRLEDKLFEMPITMMRSFEYELSQVNDALTSEITKCEDAVNEGRKESQKSLEEVTVALSSVRGDFVALNDALKGLNNMVEERTGSQSAKMQEMESVAQKVSETESLHARNLRKKIKNLMNQMKTLKNAYEEANALVYGLMARNAIVAESSGDESIVMLLKLDSQLREARESVQSIASASEVLEKLVSNLKDDIITSRHGNDSHIDEEDHTDLVGACDHITEFIWKVNDGVKEAQEFCKKHDDNLAERWVGFASVIQAAKSTATLSTKLKAIRSDLDKKPSQKQLQDAIEASGTDVTPIANQITELRDIIAKQKEDMDAMQHKVTELQDKHQMLSRSQSNVASRPDSAAPPAILPPIQPDRTPSPTENIDLTATLQPMIKDIVDTYMQSWSEENRRADNESTGWVDSQQDDDSWYQDSAEEAAEEPVFAQFFDQSESEYIPGSAPVVSQQDIAANDEVDAVADILNSYVPALEDYLEGEDKAEKAPSEYVSRTPSSSRPGSGYEENISRPPSHSRPSTGDRENVSRAPSTSRPGTGDRENVSRAPSTSRPGTGSMDSQSKEPIENHTSLSASASEKSRAPSLAPGEDSESRPPSRGGKSKLSSRQSSRAGSRSRNEHPAQQKPIHAVNESCDKPETKLTSDHQPETKPASRGSSGRRKKSGAIDSAAVSKIREDLIEVTGKLEAMYINKMDQGAAQMMLRGKADKITLSEKADLKVIKTIEGAIDQVKGELGDLRNLQNDSLRIAKEQMAEKLDRALKELLKSERDSTRGVSLASAKSLCLSCGRESLQKTNAIPTSPRGYLPSLSRSTSPGPDVLRGGFRMPVSAPDSTIAHNSKSTTGLPSSPSQPRVGTGGAPRSHDPILFSRSLSTSLYDRGAVQVGFNDDDTLQSSKSFIQSIPDVPIVAMPVGYNQVRPMYRKGFPAKKSTRPPVSNSFLLMNYLILFCIQVMFSHDIFNPNAPVQLNDALSIRVAPLDSGGVKRIKIQKK